MRLFGHCSHTRNVTLLSVRGYLGDIGMRRNYVGVDKVTLDAVDSLLTVKTTADHHKKRNTSKQ
jgi:hypothetical protein